MRTFPLEKATNLMALIETTRGRAAKEIDAGARRRSNGR